MSQDLPVRAEIVPPHGGHAWRQLWCVTFYRSGSNRPVHDCYGTKHKYTLTEWGARRKACRWIKKQTRAEQIAKVPAPDSILITDDNC